MMNKYDFFSILQLLSVIFCINCIPTMYLKEMTMFFTLAIFSTLVVLKIRIYSLTI